MTEPIRVLIVDDQALVREGLSTLLEIASGITPVGSAGNGREAVAMCSELHPDVVLMDLHMPELGGVEAIREIKADRPQTEIVVLTTFSDEQSILDALHAGARGYLTKDAGIAEISRAVEAAAAGQAVLDPVVQGRLLATTRRSEPGAGSAAPAARAPESLPDELTPREAEVLRLIARGLSNHEIADTLVLSHATVKTHVNHVFSKTGSRDRAQAVHYAYQRGLAD